MNGEWYLFNDEKVTEVSKVEAIDGNWGNGRKTTNAYMLVYVLNEQQALASPIRRGVAKTKVRIERMIRSDEEFLKVVVFCTEKMASTSYAPITNIFDDQNEGSFITLYVEKEITLKQFVRRLFDTMYLRSMNCILWTVHSRIMKIRAEDDHKTLLNLFSSKRIIFFAETAPLDTSGFCELALEPIHNYAVVLLREYIRATKKIIFFKIVYVPINETINYLDQRILDEMNCPRCTELCYYVEIIDLETPSYTIPRYSPIQEMNLEPSLPCLVSIYFEVNPPEYSPQLPSIASSQSIPALPSISITQPVPLSPPLSTSTTSQLSTPSTAFNSVTPNVRLLSSTPILILDSPPSSSSSIASPQSIKNVSSSTTTHDQASDDDDDPRIEITLVNCDRFEDKLPVTFKRSKTLLDFRRYVAELLNVEADRIELYDSRLIKIPEYLCAVQSIWTYSTLQQSHRIITRQISRISLKIYYKLKATKKT